MSDAEYQEYEDMRRAEQAGVRMMVPGSAKNATVAAMKWESKGKGTHHGMAKGPASRPSRTFNNAMSSGGGSDRSLEESAARLSYHSDALDMTDLEQDDGNTGGGHLQLNTGALMGDRFANVEPPTPASTHDASGFGSEDGGSPVAGGAGGALANVHPPSMGTLSEGEETGSFVTQSTRNVRRADGEGGGEGDGERGEGDGEGKVGGGALVNRKASEEKLV